MWTKVKEISHSSSSCRFIYTDKIDYIDLIHFEKYRNDYVYSLLYVGIEGKKYVSLENLFTVPQKGFCTLVDSSEERDGFYLCDDSVIIAAICRFIFSFYNTPSPRMPEVGYSLPLLSRELSRKFLAWHQIPHPVGEKTD